MANTHPRRGSQRGTALNQNQQHFDTFCRVMQSAHGLSKMTIQAYRWKLQPFFDVMCDIPLERWGYADVEDYIAEQAWQGQTKAKFVNCMNKFVRWCNNRGVAIDANLTGAMKFRSAPRKEPTVATRDEVLCLLDGTHGTRLEKCIALAALAGLRRSEVDTLQWEDVLLDDGALIVRSPKTHKNRRVAVSDRLADVLRRWKTADSTGQVIGWSSFAGTSGNGNRALAGACKRLGLRRLSWYSLRHCFCTSILTAGVPLKTVAKLMGHHMTTTSLYAHADPKSEREPPKLAPTLQSP